MYLGYPLFGGGGQQDGLPGLQWLMQRNDCHPRKVITYAIVYIHNRPEKACSADWKKEENPAFTSGRNTV